MRWSRALVTLPMMASTRRGLNLIFDADDTLWDSNVHFLQAEVDFIEVLVRAGVSDRALIREALTRHELSIIESHGYGRRPYVMALERAMAELAAAASQQAIRMEIERIATRLLDRHCELLPDVAATLGELSQRHRLLLFTKGQPQEQMRKLEHSGLRPLFSRIGIPLEKNQAAYELLLAQAGLDAADTVMIGNSPRSDINPALRAGLSAVYIPHPHTWELEQENIDPAADRLITLTRFRRLLEVF
ncbi:MAG: HAD family hydrolase [Candidatus Binataceae bacterium]